jgi:hypothetical protein
VLTAVPGFDAAPGGVPARLRRSAGVEVELAVARWHDPATTCCPRSFVELRWV